MYPRMTNKYFKIESGSDSEDMEPPTPRFLRATRQPVVYNVLLVVIALFATNAATWLYATKSSPRPTYFDDGRSAFEDRSPYAGLKRDTLALLDSAGPYTDANETIRDKVWLDINVDDGMIAIDDHDVARWGLPSGQIFPWDKSKQIYLLQGHHNLHCARSIYISLMEYRTGAPQSRKHHHIIHCLDALRRDVICSADDIPRYTTPDPSPETGHGQHRQCRSWDALNKWAKEHNACYRYNHEELGVDYPEIQRFVWCPEGSPYRKEVDKYFVVDYDEPRGDGII